MYKRQIQKTNRLIREIRAQIGKLKEWIADLFKARETAPEQPPQSPNPVSYTHLDVYKRQQLDEIVDILLETVCTNRKSIRVAGDDYPAELVKAKFLKLDSHHIEFVMDCLRDNTTKVRNIN